LLSLFDLSLQLFVCNGVGWLELIGNWENLYWRGLAAIRGFTKLDLVEERYGSERFLLAFASLCKKGTGFEELIHIVLCLECLCLANARNIQYSHIGLFKPTMHLVLHLENRLLKYNNEALAKDVEAAI